MRRYDLFGCHNLRPVGGFPLEGGQAAEGVFFRSDLPLCLGEAEEAFLGAWDIRTVIDLRDGSEMDTKPDPLGGCGLVSWHNVPLGGAIPAVEDGIPESYVTYFHNREAMATILALLGGEGGCLYHCAAGKDRTGVVSAILMWAAGACYGDIAADYVVSETFIRPTLSDLRRVRPDLPAFAGRSKERYIKWFYDALTGEFPTARAYFDWLGLGGETVEQLAQKIRGV